MHTKRFNTFFKIWEQSRVGAIPRLPVKINVTISGSFLTGMELQKILTKRVPIIFI